MRGLRLENRVFPGPFPGQLVSPSSGTRLLFLAIWQHQCQVCPSVLIWYIHKTKQRFTVHQWWAELRVYPHRHPHYLNEALERSCSLLRVPVSRISLPQWNPGGLKELTQLQNYLSLSHRRTCPQGESGSMLRIHCQKVKWKPSLDLCTWIPPGERRQGRDISFLEFLATYPNRPGCKEKQWSLKAISQKRPKIRQREDPPREWVR